VPSFDLGPDASGKRSEHSAPCYGWLTIDMP
jgi:hypothetical protein